MKPRPDRWVAGACLAFATATASMSATADGPKDVVLDRVTPSVASSPTPPGPDAMVVSVLLESPDGSLIPKSTNTLFHTGDRFRVKVLASRDGKVSLYNTNPMGVTNPAAVWRGNVKFGQETISPRLALTGTSGVDQLHVVFEPPQERGVFAWLGSWLHRKDGVGKDAQGAPESKDIRLDTANSPTTSYFLSRGEPGLVATVAIVHTR